MRSSNGGYSWYSARFGGGQHFRCQEFLESQDCGPDELRTCCELQQWKSIGWFLGHALNVRFYTATLAMSFHSYFGIALHRQPCSPRNIQTCCGLSSYALCCTVNAGMGKGQHRMPSKDELVQRYNRMNTIPQVSGVFVLFCSPTAACLNLSLQPGLLQAPIAPGAG